MHIKNLVTQAKKSGLSLDKYTSSAAFLINCFAGSLQIEGMVRTQKTSVGKTSSCLVIAPKACSFKNLMDSLKTARSENDLPVSSFILILLRIICAKASLFVSSTLV